MFTTIREYITHITRTLNELEAAGATGHDLSEFDVPQHLANALEELEQAQVNLDEADDDMFTVVGVTYIDR